MQFGKANTDSKGQQQQRQHIAFEERPDIVIGNDTQDVVVIGVWRVESGKWGVCLRDSLRLADGFCGQIAWGYDYIEQRTHDSSGKRCQQRID